MDGYWPQSMKNVTFLIRKCYLIIFVDSEINNCEISELAAASLTKMAVHLSVVGVVTLLTE